MKENKQNWGCYGLTEAFSSSVFLWIKKNLQKQLLLLKTSVYWKWHCLAYLSLLPNHGFKIKLLKLLPLPALRCKQDHVLRSIVQIISYSKCDVEREKEIEKRKRRNNSRKVYGHHPLDLVTRLHRCNFTVFSLKWWSLSWSIRDVGSP